MFVSQEGLKDITTSSGLLGEFSLELAVYKDTTYTVNLEKIVQSFKDIVPLVNFLAQMLDNISYLFAGLRCGLLY